MTRRILMAVAASLLLAACDSNVGGPSALPRANPVPDATGLTAQVVGTVREVNGSPLPGVTLSNAFFDEQQVYYCSPCRQIRGALPADTTVRLTWSGAHPLDLWAGQFYGTGIHHVEGSPGVGELTLRLGQPVDTLLVGRGMRNGSWQPPVDPIAFTLIAEASAP